MENYMDSAFAVTNQTIISYCGKHPILKIPSRLANIEIARIGHGAFMDSKELQCVILPPTVKEIGIQSFINCPQLSSVFVPGGLHQVSSDAFGNLLGLKDVNIYDLELTESEYSGLKAAGVENLEREYILLEMPDHPLVQCLVASFEDIKPAHRIPGDISSLLYTVTFNKETEKFPSDKNVQVIGVSVPSQPVTEDAAFRRHIKSGNPEPYDIKAEEKNDWYVRVGQEPKKERTVIFTFDDKKTKRANGKYLIQAALRIGYFFWQSAQTVVCENKKYYIYRRHYLNSNPEMSYVRRDVAVYSDVGLVTHQAEAQKVYAKYKLLSLL